VARSVHIFDGPVCISHDDFLYLLPLKLISSSLFEALEEIISD
jgi:hypothetical protein